MSIRRPGGVFDDSDNESDGGASPAPESPPGRKEPARSSDGAKAQLTAGRSLHEPGVAVKADVDTHKVEEPSAMRPPGSSEARAPEGDGPEACGPEGIGRESDNRTTATTAAAGTAAAAAAAAAATGMPPWGMMAGAWQAARHNPMMAAAMAGYPPASMGLMSMGTPMRGFPSMGLMTGMPGGPMPWQTGFRGFMPFISPASQTPPAESADVGMVKEEEKEEDEEDDEFAAAVREAEKVVAPHVSAQGSGNVEEKEEVKPRTSAASLPPRAPEPERREDVGRLESAASCAADREMERAAMKEAQPASASQHEDVRRAVPEAEEDDELTEDDETVPGDRIRPMDSASLAPAEPATSTAATTAPIAAPPASWPENVRLMNLEVPAGGMSSGQWDPLSRICHKDAATLAREMKAAEARQNAQQRRAQKRAQQSKGRSSSISSAAPTMSPDPQPGKAVEAPKVPVPVPTASSVLIPPVPAVPPEPALDPVGQARAMRILLAQRARKERRKNHVATAPPAAPTLKPVKVETEAIGVESVVCSVNLEKAQAPRPTTAPAAATNQLPPVATATTAPASVKLEREAAVPIVRAVAVAEAKPTLSESAVASEAEGIGSSGAAATEEAAEDMMDVEDALPQEGNPLSLERTNSTESMEPGMELSEEQQRKLNQKLKQICANRASATRHRERMKAAVSSLEEQ
eukprot:gene8556-10155_t